jgi:hypothetical protein
MLANLRQSPSTCHGTNECVYNFVSSCVVDFVKSVRASGIPLEIYNYYFIIKEHWSAFIIDF